MNDLFEPEHAFFIKKFVVVAFRFQQHLHVYISKLVNTSLNYCTCKTEFMFYVHPGFTKKISQNKKINILKRLVLALYFTRPNYGKCLVSALKSYAKQVRFLI
jgi:hypothetical protein